MAALMRHGVLKTIRKHPFRHLNHVNTIAPRAYATKAEKRKGIDRKQPPKIDAQTQSLAAKGFLRPYDSYFPPADLLPRLDSIFEKVLGSTEDATKIENLIQKFQLCTACAKEFDRAIPNSVLHTIETINDVKNFYQTPVDTVTPLDKMRHMELPENLHVQFEYHRFHPETDTMFKGQTAFNRSSTIVSGLKYRGKYKGHVQNETWPFNS